MKEWIHLAKRCISQGNAMRAKIIHVTDHAIIRWNERVSINENIVGSVQLSRVIKKGENLPYGIPRLEGNAYSIYKGILFVLESVSIDEYRLVTVICTESSQGFIKPPKNKKTNKAPRMDVLDEDNEEVFRRKKTNRDILSEIQKELKSVQKELRTLKQEQINLAETIKEALKKL